MSIYNIAIGTDYTTIFESTPNIASIGPSGASAVTSIYFCNITSNQVDFSVFLVPSGQLPEPRYTIYNSIQLSPTDTYVIDTERLLLDSGDRIIAKSTTASAVVSSVVYTGI